MNEPTNKPPIQEIKIGAIKAAIWANAVPSGGIRHSVTFARLYKDGDAWKSCRALVATICSF